MSMYLNHQESNRLITELISKDKPFYIARLGLGYETHLSFIHANQLHNGSFPPQWIDLLHIQAGIYGRNIFDYCETYNLSLQNADYLACFDDCPRMFHKQDYYCMKNKLTPLHFKCLEPFYALKEGMVPWTMSLKGKKVLIINPFVTSIKKQNESNFKIFKDTSLFDKNQEFVYYKPFNATCLERPHKNWLETLNKMKSDICKLNYDIALVSCGGYGLPLCSFIKSTGKSCIYVGGGLQMMFGVMGQRWENNPLFKDNNNYIRPSEDETPKNKDLVEGGCYY